MPIVDVLVLALVQGLAELLPVSSSAHVIIVERCLGLDPSAPALTLLLVLLHTGTMAAVIVYFWQRWRARLAAQADRRRGALLLIGATAMTAVVGYPLTVLIEHLAAAAGYLPIGTDPASRHQDIERLFGNLQLLAAALAAVGILILVAGLAARRRGPAAGGEIGTGTALTVGAVQGLCLPLRGFSRSGATISSALLMGTAQRRAEEFSFALAVLITPAAIAREGWRVLRDHQPGDGLVSQVALPGLIGMVVAFLAGLMALRWLSHWLERGQWHWFGVYCVILATAVAVVARLTGA